MRLSNVNVIFRREVRDQLRDRRTLFMIFVLPILLYPMLGYGVLQLTVNFEQKTRVIVVVGAELPPKDTPPLLSADGHAFHPDLFGRKAESEKLRVIAEPSASRWRSPEYRREELRKGTADAVVLIPEDIRDRLGRPDRPTNIPIAFDSADDRGERAYSRVRELLEVWNERIADKRLAAIGKTPAFTSAVRPRAENVASAEESGASVWARLFPFLLVMMALTGAFYPAVDICAGEKERGTMETLLISPASRTEIVMGKFLTVLLASIATALLNLLSMGLTGWRLATLFGTMGQSGASSALAIRPPSFTSACWMVLLLIPLSMFFSALCLALAVLAKSMKEGQYYMTPLYLVTLPLIFLTLAPGVELNLFYSMVPVTGVSLLLRALMLGDYAVARRFFLPVLIPTIVYGAIALRWAVELFLREDVLFRESERFSLGSWARHLVYHKEETPTGGQALFCFALMLSSAWFLLVVMSSTLGGMIAGQAAIILAPPVILAFLLTSNPRKTLRLHWPERRYLVLAVGLALAVNPLVGELRQWVEYLFPAPTLVKEQLAKIMETIHGNLGLALLGLAVVPAICEEVAFRGFILSGLQRAYSERTSIILSALLFGFLHVLLSLFQQLFNASILGLLLGLLAIRSRSLLPGIIFHFINNGLAVVMAHLLNDPKLGRYAPWIYRNPVEGLFHWHWIAIGATISALLLTALYRSGEVERTPEPAAVW